MPDDPPLWRRLGFAIAAVALGAAVRVAALSSLGSRATYITLYPAVMVAALYGGLTAGLLATALSAIVGSYFWMEPANRWDVDSLADGVSLAVFALSGSFISWACEAKRRAQSAAIAAETESRHAQERQGAAEELQRTSEQARFLARIIESAEQPLGVGYPDGRLGIVNPAFCELTGYSAEELHSIDWAKTLTPPEWREPEMAALAELERTGKPVRYQKEYIRKDGSRVPVEMLVQAERDAAGKVQYYYSFITDITQRQEAERTQKLESVGLLAGGIAHDFNNLLTAILGHASLLMDDAAPGEAPTIQAIIASAQRAAHLTRQLLAYSGKGQFIVKNLNLTSAVRELSDFLGMSIPKSVELRLDLRERLPLVLMDPGQFHQVVMNLVINAGEAIGEANEGTIAVSTDLHDADRPFDNALGGEAPAGRYVCLEVADSGPGMDDKTKAKIFDPFFTTKFTGRGLGLAAVSGIVRSLKGAITVWSVPGQGSAFRVFFPAVWSGGGPADREPARESGPTVLVIDDEESVRRFLTAALRRYGYRVLQAADGREALAVCSRVGERVDAVVLDIVMPVMGAAEFLPEITRRWPDLKVLLTSGYNEAEAKRLCVSYSGAAFLQKPYTAQALAKALEDLLVQAPGTS